jgi:ABC-type hemin transport system ATPase subunit
VVIGPNGAGKSTLLGALAGDRPTNRGQALDETAAAAFADRGVAVLAVLHDLTMASRYADRIAIIERGRLKALGPASTTLDPVLVPAVFATPVVRFAVDGPAVFPSPGQNIAKEHS